MDEGPFYFSPALLLFLRPIPRYYHCFGRATATILVVAGGPFMAANVSSVATGRATTRAGASSRISLPLSSHRPAPYSGPPRDEVLALRRQYLTPGLITYYKEPLLIVEG